MKLKEINLVLILLILDLGSKALAATLEPHNSIFLLTYNPHMTLGFKANDLVKFVFPLFCIPFVWNISKIPELTRSQKHLSLSFFVAGMIGNYSCRFHPLGVIDFINFKYFIANFADFYLWTGSVILFKSFYSNSRKIALQKTE